MQLENAHEYSLPSVLHWAAADGRAARAAIAIIWMRSIMEEGREDFYGTWGYFQRRDQAAATTLVGATTL